MRRQTGFSLIELLIVVAVFLIIAAIAIPSLLRSRMAANESSAVSTIRQISTAEFSYRITYPDIGYSPDLPGLGGPAAGCTPTPAHACILDSTISAGSKSGYQFFAAGFASAGATENTQFVASSAPLIFNRTGIRNFCIATDDGAVRAVAGALGAPPAPSVPTCLVYPVM